MKYDVDYFIKKFKAIPKEEWCIETFSDQKGRYCALGHCGVNAGYITPEASALERILYFNVAEINDGIDTSFKGKHPRTRIVNALKQIKKKSVK